MTQVSERQLLPDVAATAVAVADDTSARDTRPTECVLSVLIPTRNEAANVEPLVERLSAALGGLPAEAVFVDDSDDATPVVVAAVIRERASDDPLRVTMLHRRPGDREGGLSGAIVAGLAVARGTWVCVMDGDLQHPPETILGMLAAAEAQDATLVVASRYRVGGDSAGLDGAPRRLASHAAAGAAKLLFWKSLRDVTDPMSGFFLFRRDAVVGTQLRPRGFKILIELAVRTPGLRLAEVPYTFQARHAGESKAGCREAINYLRHLVRLRVDVSRRTPAPSR